VQVFTGQRLIQACDTQIALETRVVWQITQFVKTAYVFLVLEQAHRLVDASVDAGVAAIEIVLVGQKPYAFAIRGLKIPHLFACNL